MSVGASAATLVWGIVKGAPRVFLIPSVLIALAAGLYVTSAISAILRHRRLRSTRVTLPVAARLLAFDSTWAAAFDLSKERFWKHKTDWRGPLGAELCRPLIAGEIKAWGIRSTKSVDRDNNETRIPPEFWLQARITPDLLLEGDTADFAGSTVDDNKIFYSQITLDGRDVAAVWPLRSKRQVRRRPSPFRAWSDELKLLHDEQLRINQAAWFEDNADIYS